MTPVPEFLVVAIDQVHVLAITEWWNRLTDAQQRELLDDATNQPSSIATQTDLELPLEDEPNDWYEYIVNQDMRFYFDVHNGQQTSHGYSVSPMLTAISAATDAKVVSHLLKRNSG